MLEQFSSAWQTHHVYQKGNCNLCLDMHTHAGARTRAWASSVTFSLLRQKLS